MLNAFHLCKSPTSLTIQTLITLLERCKSMSDLKQIHSILITLGLTDEDPLPSRIVSFSSLSDAGDVDYSHRFLLSLQRPTTSCWNTTIRGYSKSRTPGKSLRVFVQMLRAGAQPDHLTFPFLAKAAARMSEHGGGATVHCHVARLGLEADRFIANSLVHMYATCGDISSARKVFDGIPDKNLVSWNSMLDGYAKCGDMTSARTLFETTTDRDVVSWSSLIDGYVKAGEYSEAMALFERMQNARWPQPNDVTMVSVLSACTHLGSVEKGRLLHSHLSENGMPMTLTLRTSLIDMYAKCGAIEEAMTVFREAQLDRNRTDVLLWNAMIGGLASHGLVHESLEIFAEMQRIRIAPDEITYLCLLSACAHGGLVQEAFHFLESLKGLGMDPKSEHYACVIDALSRSGRIEEAWRFMTRIPMEPTGSMLGALLSGCLSHGRLDVAEAVGKRLIEMEPDHDGRYVGLSNAYAVVKRWEEAKGMREEMERRGLKKSPGFSSVESGGWIHRFIAHDKTHRSSEEIYRMLDLILRQVRPRQEVADGEDEECCLYDIAAG
ncbi:hypothetical protein SAY87_002627 [Trapa incisa]|uniref:Pentatricopeptide repeat-containing protein n=1 Tax=Trapa incisa TaxID=236973 RepID=A0AAN7JZZ2_9MYRT|nr:hypothetical protein SAY87_002627 [Trapa incisa]